MSNPHSEISSLIRRDRVKDAIRALSKQPAEQIAQTIKQGVMDFSHHQAMQDDRSIIVAKIL